MLPNDDFPKIKPICALTVWEENFTVTGDSDMVIFKDRPTGKYFEMTWNEIYEACVDYRQAKENEKKTYA